MPLFAVFAKISKSALFALFPLFTVGVTAFFLGVRFVTCDGFFGVDQQQNNDTKNIIKKGEKMVCLCAQEKRTASVTPGPV